LDAKVREH